MLFSFCVQELLPLKKLSPQCEMKVIQVTKISALNYKLDPILVEKCNDDVSIEDRRFVDDFFPFFNLCDVDAFLTKRPMNRIDLFNTFYPFLVLFSFYLVRHV